MVRPLRFNVWRNTMFKNRVQQQYQIVAMKPELLRFIEEAREEVDNVKKELEVARTKYKQLEQKYSKTENEKTLKQAEEMWKTVDALEEEVRKALLNYEDALNTTYDDLMADPIYEELKDK